MKTVDLLVFTGQSLGRHTFRSAMMLLSMAVGVAAVVVLTGLGEGARSYVLGQFSFLGTDTVVVLPGKKETTGGLPPMMGTAARDITLSDAETIGRMVSGIKHIAPLLMGTAPISFASRSRETLVVGTTRDFFAIRQLEIARGQALPEIPLQTSKGLAVIGQTVQHELFGSGKVIGEFVRVGDRRFRVIGVIKGRGDAFGIDLSDAVLIPVGSAQAIFNTQALFRLFIKVKPNADMTRVETQLLKTMTELHQGEEDVTLIRPDSLVGAFNDVLLILTLAISGIAAISLIVAGILIMNITLISVTQRTREIGLLKAIGASSAQIRTLFLVEAGVLAVTGAILGISIGHLLLAIGTILYPDIQFAAPNWAVASAFTIAVSTGLLFAYLPARRAARLEPVTALTS